MSDLISRQAVIDLLKQMRKDGDMVPWEGKDVFARIRELPSAQPEQQWIPCSEGPPKESGTYTVTAYNGATNRVTYAKYQKRLKRWELTGARAYWRVLAWCPLPEPYREEEQHG